MPDFFSQMIHTASCSADQLDTDALEDITSFILSRMTPDGGFQGRSEECDLYYTCFALMSLHALGKTIPDETRKWTALQTVEPPKDRVHIASLIICLELTGQAQKADLLRQKLQPSFSDALLCGIFGSKDTENLYSIFLSMLCMKNPGALKPHAERLIKEIQKFQLKNSAYASEPGSIHISTPATAAALAVLFAITIEPNPETIKQLITMHDPKGGFKAAELTPLPDLLSTATALFALDLHQSIPPEIIKPCLKFIEDCWLDNGGFCGSLADDTPDCEYAFYGLLALGCVLKQ